MRFRLVVDGEAHEVEVDGAVAATAQGSAAGTGKEAAQLGKTVATSIRRPCDPEQSFKILSEPLNASQFPLTPPAGFLAVFNDNPCGTHPAPTSCRPLHPSNAAAGRTRR